jgi:enoyl-CoA hydratase/carnithine racemase
MSDRVRVTLDAGVADVRLARPDKINALDGDMFQALRETGRQLAQEPGLRAVVLSGEGRGFCAGLDFSSFAAMGNSGDGSGKSAGGNLLDSLEDSPANNAQSPAWVWQELPVPVIAAVHGVAYGGGLQIALGADIRIVAPDARLSVMEIKWGLVPDMSATQTLRHLVRLDVAKDLTFTGRIVDGNEAVEIGLATRVSERPYDDALDLARTIASKSPDAIRAGKRLLNETTRDLGVADGLGLEAELQKGLLGRPNQIESVKANLEKRAPRYQD